MVCSCENCAPGGVGASGVKQPMSNLKADVPLINLPLVGADGRMNETWFMFFIQLFRRTGGTMGSSPGDLRLSDTDIDADSIDADLRFVTGGLDEIDVTLQTSPDNSVIYEFARALNSVNVALNTLADEGSDKARYSDLVARSTEIAVMLQEAQDVFVKMRLALNDAIIDNMTPLEPIRSMAYQDASNVKIKGGSIDG